MAHDDDPGIAVVVPMLGRAHRVAPLLANIIATAPQARVVFCCTPGDDEVISAVDDAVRQHPEVVRWIVVERQPRGDYARKINTAVRVTTEEHLFLGADDLLFHPGWLSAARRKLTPGIGVVGTNDLGNPRVLAGDHATHWLITRSYITAFGTIDERGKALHEGYPHEYVDDELIATAKHRRAWAFAADSHVEHLHPNWGKAPMDATYAAQPARMRAGRPLYLNRSLLWK